MKAQNYAAIRKAILKFTWFLIASVVLATCFFFFFMKTSSVEVSKILDKTKDYDKIQTIQLDLKEKVDSIYYYSSWLTYDSKINYRLMQNTLSERKLQLFDLLLELPKEDALLYGKLAKQMNIFFNTKDSLIIATSELNTVREDLIQCMSENRKITRKISIGGGLTLNK